MLMESPNNKGTNIFFFIMELEKIKEQLEDIIVQLESIKGDEK